MKIKFPENLYCDVRIENNKTACYAMQNDEVLAKLAAPDPKILENPIVKKLQHKQG